MAEHTDHEDNNDCPACIEETDAFTDGYAEGVAAERERCAKKRSRTMAIEGYATVRVTSQISPDDWEVRTRVLPVTNLTRIRDIVTWCRQINVLPDKVRIELSIERVEGEDDD